MIPLVVFSLPTFFYCQNIDADVLATGFFGKCVITYSMKCIGGENTTNENNSQTSYLFHYIFPYSCLHRCCRGHISL